jgi:hypothetical protein
MPIMPQLSNSKPRIFKYTFGHLDRGILVAKVEGPPIRKILDIQEQVHTLVLWAEVDTAWMGAQTDVELYCAYTGDPPPGNDWSYFKTIQSQTDGLVYHLYLKDLETIGFDL